jgi:hypothetical protein
MRDVRARTLDFSCAYSLLLMAATRRRRARMRAILDRILFLGFYNEVADTKTGEDTWPY